jgi:hypothetical protein
MQQRPPLPHPSSKVWAHADHPGHPNSIVAVHGLNGDSLNTWTHVPEGGKGPETLWLRDLLPGKLPNAHVMSFQYDSSTCGMSEQSVRGNAGKLVRLLRDIREDYVCAHHLPRIVSRWG